MYSGRTMNHRETQAWRPSRQASDQTRNQNNPPKQKVISSKIKFHQLHHMSPRKYPPYSPSLAHKYPHRNHFWPARMRDWNLFWGHSQPQGLVHIIHPSQTSNLSGNKHSENKVYIHFGNTSNRLTEKQHAIDGVAGLVDFIIWRFFPRLLCPVPNMTKPSNYSPKVSLPGEFIAAKKLPGEFTTNTTSSVMSAPVVVKLETGEKVKLLAPDKPSHRKPSPDSLCESSCKSIRTIPGKHHSRHTSSSSQTHVLKTVKGPEDGFNRIRMPGARESPDNEESSHMTGFFDALDPPAERSDVSSKEVSSNVQEVTEDADQGVTRAPVIGQSDVVEAPSEATRSNADPSISETSVPNPSGPQMLGEIPDPPIPDPPIPGPPIPDPPIPDPPIPDPPIPDQSPASRPFIEESIYPFDPLHVMELTNGSPGLDESSPGSNGSPGLVSPEAMISFSPEDVVEVQTRIQIKFTLSEIIQSEYAYIKSLSLLGNFLIEPLILKCSGLKLTCTPLLNMESGLKALREKHERFLARVSSENNIDQMAREMTDLVMESSYGTYAACAELLLFLVNRQVPPFESAYVNNLQTFLEWNQPGERRMDLSLSSLLQKPMGRIAKYRLFLGSLAKLCPEQTLVLEAMALVNDKLTEINDEIRSNKERQAVLESVAQWLDLSGTYVPVYQYYGLLNLLGKCTIMWLTYNRKGPSYIVSRESHLLVHDNHIIFADIKQQKPLFVLSFANCQFVSDPVNSDGGLYSDDPLSLKIVFEKDDCRYEVIVVSSTSDAHEAFMRSCENIPRSPLKYSALSDADCFIGPAVAQLDINVSCPNVLQTWRSTCYFGEIHHVSQRPSSFSFRTMGGIFRRGLSWQSHR
ncbi:hypothetical protein JCM33374_g3701 [Metschnikowia sp. JCM 33374]|nr:hypothetical protein JCM33374_g3701 [Metschnikowia sp. JCM 33374]